MSTERKPDTPVVFTEMEVIENSKMQAIVQKNFLQLHPEITSPAQSDLAKMILDESITSLPRNEFEWHFPVNDRWIRLVNLEEKKAYVFRAAALTAFLVEDENRAREYLWVASELPAESSTGALTLLESDIEKIGSVRPELRPLLCKFSRDQSLPVSSNQSLDCKDH